ncbi:hypothetical protein [Rhodanobacter sp. DHG33]|uniref:hypothetical protein n=1 Tax=Rhodanobacter sp. DHG33 TaxID=2775921 RepID=UPI0017818192|nr:hypothetical protein [Rhodanobacter sp. DHG33]MBD8898041.1 hypothetical protein [Rhodanobacter sp. DHG33]
MVFLMILLGASPVLFAALIGGVVALVFWRRAPRSALLVLIACAVQFAVTSFGVWLQGWWLPASREAGGTMAHFAQLMGIWGMCGSVLHAVVIGLLVWAAFARRPQARSAPPPLT